MEQHLICQQCNIDFLFVSPGAGQELITQSWRERLTVLLNCN